ncbi:glycosyltransferase [Devosia aurantiaca]|uniref:Glycosyltransferase n=1 Tax=Devosia aurantiaca TaxID=2714858 RepID=A0A6M1T0T4_9HYPH|nr:glycosyltransferase [Devosia aurantiaca]NGP18511.1 glycosyltransferase [Devosia aurantiaca]
MVVIPIGINEPSQQVISGCRWTSLLARRFFLFVGAFRYYKGLNILLEAAQNAPFSVAIAGAGSIEAELKAQATKLGLSNVHFLGQISGDEKTLLLNNCCGVVFPSHLRSEAFGVSLVEGAAHSKPLISSEIGTGTSFVNIHGETGLVVNPSDSASLRGAMIKLWSDDQLAAVLGKGARRRYEALFTAERMVDGYIDLYQKLLDRSPIVGSCPN